MRKTLLMTTTILSGLALGGAALAADPKTDANRNDPAAASGSQTEMKDGARSGEGMNSGGATTRSGAASENTRSGDTGAAGNVTTGTGTTGATGNVSTDAGAAGDQNYRSYSQSEGFQGDIAGGYTAEELIGKNILDVNGDTIGEIGDLLIDSDDKVSSVLVDVGGFLGIGEKRVAMQLSELTRAEDGFTTAATEEQLKGRVSYVDSEDRWQPDIRDRDDSRAAPASPNNPSGAPAR